MGRMAVASAGSVLGEQAFFDAKPRSTGVWSVDDCEIAARVRTSMHTRDATAHDHGEDRGMNCWTRPLPRVSSERRSSWACISARQRCPA